MADLKQQAQDNLAQRIQANRYPGRGLILGLCEDGDSLVQVYWIMGRSANSRNRVFRAQDGAVWTEAADPSKVEDPRLIIYNAMREVNGAYIVTNGDQTDTIYQGALHGMSFDQALATRNHEPDAPNFTPRISGVFEVCADAVVAKISVVEASPFGPESSLRAFFHLERLAPGLGHCVTTYTGDGSPLPAFEGEPYLLPLAGDAEAIADTLWAALDADNKVSLAVKTIRLEDGMSQVTLRNKLEPAG